jgi:hypothetical protein
MRLLYDGKLVITWLRRPTAGFAAHAGEAMAAPALPGSPAPRVTSCGWALRRAVAVRSATAECNDYVALISCLIR